MKKTSGPVVENLRCEYLPNPLGIDVTTPRLSWEITGGGRGTLQQAYRILVASSPEKLKNDEGDLWDSGKVTSGKSLDIKYAGKPLQSRMNCYWKVKIWTADGQESGWSDPAGHAGPASWSMGLLQPSDWSARWTGLDTFFAADRPHDLFTRLSARYFRKAFNIDKKIERAIVYISGLGLYELYINGKKTGDQVLEPAPTQYDKRVFYNTYDVTGQLKSGENVIGTILGNGRFFSMRGDGSPIPPITNFGYPRMLLQLEITYEDGSRQTVVSNDNWKVTADGPILADNEYDGEDYDANKEMPGWSEAGYDDSRWMQAQLVQAPCDRIEAQMNEPIRIMDTVQPVSVKTIRPGVYVFDMGQNMVGWARLQINDGKAGDTVQLRFAERINDDGSLYTANLRSARATDHYIMKEGKQEWEPRFTYHGFRYIEVTGYPGKPALQDITGKVVYDGLETTGHFETSDKVVNGIYQNAFRGIRGNYRGMPTDCPQRDERMGWLGDRAVGSYGESFLFDNNKLYAKWLQDIEDAQREDGSVPDVAPSYWKIYSDNMTWPGAYLIIANMLHHQFANDKPIKQHYASMKKWLGYMRDKYMKDYIMTKDTYGDWCMPPEAPELIHSKDPARQTAGDYLGTAFYYRMLNLMQRFAAILGKPEDEKAFAALSAHVRDAFNNRFLHPDSGFYANNTATANIFALAYHLAPDSLRTRVFGHIVDKTLHDFDGHVSTGLVGAQWLMRSLTRNGRPDIAWKLATNTTYPSWGYMAEHGATTIWELWNGNTADPAMNSGNHVMLLGDLLVWCYEDLAGIKSDSAQAGFKKIIMKPIPAGNLTFVKASYHSVHGMIKSEWKKEGDRFNWDISIPANTTAVVYMPACSEEEVEEGGRRASGAEGVKFIRMEDGRAVFEVGSGDYHFVSKNQTI